VADGDGVVVKGGRISRIFAVRNPAKLGTIDVNHDLPLTTGCAAASVTA
jgi:hypothetical protein